MLCQPLWGNIHHFTQSHQIYYAPRLCLPRLTNYQPACLLSQTFRRRNWSISTSSFMVLVPHCQAPVYSCNITSIQESFLPVTDVNSDGKVDWDDFQCCIEVSGGCGGGGQTMTWVQKAKEKFGVKRARLKT